jgi:hypothetical protein
VRQQGGVRGGFEIGGNLQRDTVFQAAEQGVRQAEDSGSVGFVGIDGDAEQEADDQADPEDGQADAQKGAPLAGAFPQRIDVDVDDVPCVVDQTRRPSWRTIVFGVGGALAMRRAVNVALFGQGVRLLAAGFRPGVALR